MDLITLSVLAGLGIAFAGGTIFWERILEWAHDSVFAWFDEHLPTLAPLIRSAFTVINGAVFDVRKAAIAAWSEIRPRLLQMVQKFERQGPQYLLTITSYLRKKLSEKEVQVVETRRTIKLDELPPEVQKAFLQGAVKYEIDITEEKDRQVEKAVHEIGYTG